MEQCKSPDEQSVDIEHLKNKYPVQVRIVEAIFSRMNQLLLRDQDDFEQELSLVTKEIKELASYLTNAGPKATATEIQQTFAAHRPTGWATEAYLEYIEALRARPGHHSPGRRMIMFALESRIREDAMWSDITRQFCMCGKRAHSTLCEAAIRLRVSKLEERLDHLDFINRERVVARITLRSVGH